MVRPYLSLGVPVGKWPGVGPALPRNQTCGVVRYRGGCCPASACWALGPPQATAPGWGAVGEPGLVQGVASGISLASSHAHQPPVCISHHDDPLLWPRVPGLEQMFP